ncbi:nucleoside hydrolase [Dyadobacter flavalbus]|uniref:Nucleoside hydrolase n=1 Tax=Dyadobacter flavalbus TaxID=2579942 RepID=A0A5M8QUK2_9BACT|nr:nucleoside hydrolase [Dyadobacter flavalbus]KAA6438981.1 nucleoside hydrolase [Dyadobacter flavalbus]
MNYFLLGILLFIHVYPSSENRPDSIDSPAKPDKIRLIIDSDANNELDDQHALAYAFFSRDQFDLEGITINNTRNGGTLKGHYDEAVRVAKLCNAYNDVKIYKGASGNYADIQNHINEADYDGKEAVDFIIKSAKSSDSRQLVLLPIGKLTNIALALKKAPEIAGKIRIVWLGSNYPDAGEYNLDDDTTSVNPVIQSQAPFEMAVVRNGKPSGTAAVSVTPAEINARMKGKGIEVARAVAGRHGNSFTTFGDYSADLFAHADLHGNPPSRALYDMAAVAIVKNPHWAEKTTINAPTLSGNKWIDHAKTGRKIEIWENFKKDEILADFYKTVEKSAK